MDLCGRQEAGGGWPGLAVSILVVNLYSVLKVGPPGWFPLF